MKIYHANIKKLQKHAAKCIILRFQNKINPMKNHIKAIIIAVLFVLMMFLQASAQKKPFRNIDFSQHDFVDTIKIKIIDGALIVKAYIRNGCP